MASDLQETPVKSETNLTIILNEAKIKNIKSLATLKTLHKSVLYEVVIVLGKQMVVSEVIFRIHPSLQDFEMSDVM